MQASSAFFAMSLTVAPANFPYFLAILRPNTKPPVKQYGAMRISGSSNIHLSNDLNNNHRLLKRAAPSNNISNPHKPKINLSRPATTYTPALSSMAATTTIIVVVREASDNWAHRRNRNQIVLRSFRRLVATEQTRTSRIAEVV